MFTTVPASILQWSSPNAEPQHIKHILRRIAIAGVWNQLRLNQATKIPGVGGTRDGRVVRGAGNSKARPK